MKIIDNNNLTHFTALNDEIKNIKNIKIGVAFIKLSGFNIIKEIINNVLKNKINIEIYCGTDLFLTEPDALLNLFLLFKKNITGKLFITKIKNRMFHPKIYFIEKEYESIVIIGSANLTEAGLKNNIEISSINKIKNNDEEYKIIIETFNYFKNNSDEASIIEINKYKRKYQASNKIIVKSTKEITEKINNINIVNNKTLKKHLTNFNNDKNEKAELIDRKKRYIEAKKILATLVQNPSINENDFKLNYEKLVGKSNSKALWNSGGLYRHKAKIIKNYKSFIIMLKEIYANLKNNDENIFIICTKYKKIPGIGFNVMTEILNTFEPKKYAVLNKNPLTSLKELGFSIFPNVNSFKNETYEEFNTLLIDLQNLCKFQSLSQTDQFLNYIYWQIK